MALTAEVEAPAKVNLFLRVLHRRSDGFHELETLFQAVSLADRVVVSVREAGGNPGVGDSAEKVPRTGRSDGSPVRSSDGYPAGRGDDGPPIHLAVEGPDLGPAESNLAYRAARRFLQVAGIDAPVRIELTKRIPAGAGLGGGSSDAAAVLRCLATLTGFQDADALRAIALELGSDVPFFLSTSPLALGRGRGEELGELTALPKASLVLALPDVHVATGAAYGALAGSRGGAEAEGRPVGQQADDPTSTTERLSHRARDDLPEPRSWDDIVESAVNDFEPVVAPAHAEVEASLRGLRERGARLALLSGSGAASFGLFGSHEQARAAAVWLEGRHPWRFVPVTTRTIMPVPTIIRD